MFASGGGFRNHLNGAKLVLFVGTDVRYTDRGVVVVVVVYKTCKL